MILFCLGIPLVSGCLSSAPRVATNWTIETIQGAARAAVLPRREASTNAVAVVVRLASINVRAPYDTRHFAVLRADGSLAFDAYNEFAAQPAAILRSAAEEAVRDSGRFGHVIAHNSTANATHTLELTVTRLAIDCREKGTRRATITLSFLLSSARVILAEVVATASIPISDEKMDFSAAFSEAFHEAAGKALEQLPSL